MDAIIEFKEKRYVKKIYFIMPSAGDQDLLGCLYKDPEGPWTLDWRVRYYRDDKAFDSKDERSAHRSTSDDVEKLVAGMNEIIVGVVRMKWATKDEIFVLDVESDDPKVAFEILAKQPWANVRRGTLPS